VIRAGIVGGTGYTGVELLRILDAQGHPVMEWRTDTSALSDLTWENTEEGHDRLRLDLFR